MNWLVRDRQFYKNLAAIAIPVALQNVIAFGVQMMDTVMVGRLGDISLSAASLANQPYFVFAVFNFGLSSGGAVLIAQYWGRGNTEAVRRIIGISMRAITVTALVFSAVCMTFPVPIMRIFSHEAEVIAQGAAYLRVVAISYVFNGIASCYLMSLRAVENVRLSILIYSVSFCVNVFFNYCFIFGRLGFPRLGVVGAAIGTIFARVSEFLIAFLYMKFFEKKIRFTLRYLFLKEPELTPDYIRHSLPVCGSELLWSLSAVTQSAIIGRIGSTFVAANSITEVVRQLAMVMLFGIGNAAAVLVGKLVGEGRIGFAKRAGKTLIALSVLVGIASCGLVLGLRHWVVLLYNVSDQTKALAIDLMGVLAAAIVFRSVEVTCITGVLRGAGDTRFAFLADVGSAWLVCVPLGLLAAFVWKLPAVWIYIFLQIDTLARNAVCLKRIFGDNYIKNVTRDL